MSMQSEKSTCVSGVMTGELELRLDRNPTGLGPGLGRRDSSVLSNSEEVNKIKPYHFSFSPGGGPLLHPCGERFPRGEEVPGKWFLSNSYKQ